MDSERGWRRPAIAALIVVGLLAIVAATSARHSWSGGSDSSRHLSDSFWGAVVTVVACLWLGLIAWAIWTLVRERSAGERKERGSRDGLGRKIVVAFAAVALVAAISLTHRRNVHGLGGGKLPAGAPRNPATADSGPPEASRFFNGTAAVLTIAILVAIAIVAIAAGRRRRAPRAREELDAVEALARVLDDTLDDLRSETDPRRAVIAAYARMESTLSAYGLGRSRSEAPGEYLLRVLAELNATGPAAQRLTALFERARFSPHDIDERMKADAIEALVDLRAELVETAA